MIRSSFLFILCLQLQAFAASSGVCINEFVASNDNTLNDGDGNSSDWIEFYNSGPGAVDLSGWFLTDSTSNLTRWSFPTGTTLAEGSYLIVFASNRDIDTYVDGLGFLHTDFNLSSGGGYLALIEPDGTTVRSEFSPSYPVQFKDVSYGVSSSSGLVGYLSSPTPAAANSSGTADAGPEILSVTHTPAQPVSSEDLIITSQVSPRLDAIANVTLTYRVSYGGEVMIPMLDDGAGNDAVAGDSIYTATIPSSAYVSGRMVRWFVSANDASSEASRSPVFLDQSGKGRSPEYYGTVVALSSAIRSDLPLFQWFTSTSDVAASHTREGARASVYFQGRFYDNIFVRSRGGFTNFSESQKFDFNRNHPFYINEELPAVAEININGKGVDDTYLRQPLSFDTHRAAGNEACLSYLWQLQLNGRRDRVGTAIEQVDETFLDRNGYDEDGDLYKFVQRNNLNPAFSDTTTGVEKKIGDDSNNDSLQALVDGLNLPTAAERRSYIIDNLDLPQMVNYLAARAVIQDVDDLRKNFYFYLDTQGDRRWRLFPWDKDFTLGLIADGAPNFPHPFFGSEEYRKINPDQWSVFYDVIFTDQVSSRLYLRRLRTLMDELLQPASVPFEERILETMAQNLVDSANPVLRLRATEINDYFESRREVLNNDYPELIPLSQPSNPNITFGSFLQDPPSGNQEQEYLNLSNAESTEIDISGWTLSGGVNFTFRAGTVIERNGNLFVSPDLKEFLLRTTSPKAGEDNLVVGPYSGHLSDFSETIALKDRNGNIVDTLVTPDLSSDQQKFLAISEIMYRPADPNPDAEFVEIVNTSDTMTMDLTGVQFTEGINFAFPNGTMLAPGERTLIVLNQVAFEVVYGSGFNIAGEFQNDTRLGNGKDSIRLEDASGSSISEFTYDDENGWPTEPDGEGFSLVFMNPSQLPDYEDPANWRGSLERGGNPGSSDASSFVGDPNADDDGDGLTALAEYGFGTSDSQPSIAPTEVSREGNIITFTVTVNQTADDLQIILQNSATLQGWQDLTDIFTQVSRINHGDGTATISLESPPNYQNSELVHFFRVEFLRD